MGNTSFVVFLQELRFSDVFAKHDIQSWQALMHLLVQDKKLDL